MSNIVLLAEDDPVTRFYIDNIISNHGVHVLPAKDGEEAIELYRNNNVDLIITDLYMPHINGFDFISYVRQEDQETPIIVISSYYDKLFELNIQHFIRKPVDYNIIIAIVNALVKSSN
jgi:YesN/AraC family two-component response regulator